MLEQGKLMRRNVLQKQCYEQTTTPIPAQEVKEVEELGVKVVLDLFLFFITLLLFSGNKLKSLSLVCFAHDGNC